MNDQQLLRYSRHILLDELGIEGQERILAGHVLIVGAGGLGCPAALYLAAAGVGQISIADDDNVDLTNLQRQILHREASIDKPKVHSAKAALLEFNPEIRILPIKERLIDDALNEAVANADVVLDCCDNFATRHAVNRACLAYKKPLVSGAAIRFDAQISVYDLRSDDAPCYHCLFPESDDADEVRCSVMGVFAPVTGIIGTMQAAEALKILAGTGCLLSGRLLLLDALEMSWRSVNFKKDPLCKACGDH